MDTPRARQRNRRNQIAAGAALCVMALVALALQYLEGPGRAAVLLLAGVAFVASYLYSDVHGLLIPGGILAGLGLGMLGEWRGIGLRDPDAVGLGLGFLSIYAIARLNRHRPHWWPLIPGAILIATGLGARYGDVGHILWRWAPALLLLLGIVLVVRGILRHPGVKTHQA